MFGLPLPSWLLIIPVLAFLIFVHEFGHYLAAKRFGIKVLEFGFGFPPRMFGVRYGETLYSINWIPLGGFVRMLGEDNATGVPDSAEQARLESGDPDPDSGRRFTDQTPLKRAIVLVAGSFMNFLTPLVIFSIIFLFPRDVPVGTVSISGVAPRSPAAEAGIRPGDQILAVNGERVRNHYELIERVGDSVEEEIELNLRRGSIVSGLGQSPEFSVVETVTVVPRSNPPSFRVVETVTDPDTQVSLREARRYDGQLEVGDTLTQGAVGVIIGTANFRYVKERQPALQAVPDAAGRIWEILTTTKNAFQQWVGGGPNPGFTGPIGIAQVTGEVAEASDQYGLTIFFELVAFLSISLGIINILPIPALDGGKLVFVVIEWVRGGKRISPSKEGLVHVVGFAVLIGLILVVSFFDITRILSGERLIP